MRSLVIDDVTATYVVDGVLDLLREPDTFGSGCHFGDRPFGRVQVDPAGKATWDPVASVVLKPPPR